MRMTVVNVMMAVLVAVSFGMTGCGGGGSTSEVVAPQTTGSTSVAAKTSILSVGNADCPFGGILVETGIDSNKNGILDASEISNTQNVCNGATGAVGATGATGAVGATGATGATGLSSLVKLTQEAAGANCLTGGVGISIGVDTSKNGILEAGEITSTMYVCNGATGATGNSPPIANPGAEQNIVIGAVVTLDGSGSSDTNGDPLTYSWSFTSKPVGSTATLTSTTYVKPTFTPDIAGTYVLNLVVNDGKVNSTANTVSINALVQTPSFTKVFSGTTALVLDSFTLPSGIYKVSVNTTGYFQLFDVNSSNSLFNLSSGRAVNAETFIKSNGGSYIFRTANISSSWTLTFTNIDLSNPQPIVNMNSISENVPKLLGPYSIDLSMYKITMNTSGFLQLFPINPITGVEMPYIFNETSGHSGAQNVYTPTTQIILFRTDNISAQYGFSISKL